MESEILDLKQQLDKSVEENDTNNIIDLLKVISLLEISKDILQKTMIGKSVGLLRKNTNETVSKDANNLVLKWKKQLDIPPKTPEKSTTPPIKKKPTPTSSTTTTSNKPSQSSPSAASSPEPSTKLTPTLKRKLEIDDVKQEESSTSKSSSPSIVKKQNLSSRYNVELPYLSDDVRSKTMKLIADSLEDKDGPETELHHNAAAVEIETEMFTLFNGTSNDYKTKARSIIFNLKSNKALRDSILSTDISITRFCSMDSNEMANKELQEQRKKMLKNSKEAATLSRDAATTDQFQCGKCKQRKCTYFQLQTRSADEPLTTFVTCVNCNNRWKFC